MCTQWTPLLGRGCGGALSLTQEVGVRLKVTEHPVGYDTEHHKVLLPYPQGLGFRVLNLRPCLGNVLKLGPPPQTW